MSLKNKIKNLMDKVAWVSPSKAIAPNPCFDKEIIISEQRLMLTERAKEIAALHNRIDSMKGQLVPSYTEQHFNWANKEMLRLGSMVREFSERNEALADENIKLTTAGELMHKALKKAKRGADACEKWKSVAWKGNTKP